jgi:bacillopeptidase F
MVVPPRLSRALAVLTGAAWFAFVSAGSPAWAGGSGTTYTLSVKAINAVGSGPAASGPVIIQESVEDTSLDAAYTGWMGVTDPAANGGGYRYNTTTGARAKFMFSGTAVTWVTAEGPDRGIAAVTIDGVSKGTVDLYASSPTSFSKAYTGLASGPHSLVVRVTGHRDASSSGTGVVVDGFVVGSTTTQETGKAVALNTWAGVSSANASGGQCRVASASGAAATYTFSGTGVDWVTAIGPGWGKAEVYIDGVDQGTVDLDNPVPHWQVPMTYYGLTPGPHTITVKPQGTKNASATSTKVPVDGFGPPTLFHGA